MLRVFFIKSFTFSSSSFSHGKRLRASNRISNKKFQNFKKLGHLLWQFYSLKFFFSSQKNLLEVQISARETKKPLKKLSRVSLNKKCNSYFYCSSSDHGDVVDDDDDHDEDDDVGGGVYLGILSQTLYSRGLGQSHALLIHQLKCQRILADSYYRDTSCRHLESSWSV